MQDDIQVKITYLEVLLHQVLSLRQQAEELREGFEKAQREYDQKLAELTPERDRLMTHIESFVLECLNPEPDNILYPGKTYCFQARITSLPPLWHRDRLIQAEALPQDPRALFLAPGLCPIIPEPIKMRPFKGTGVQATKELTPQEEGEYLLIVRLLDGEERLQSLRLELVVRKPGVGLAVRKEV